MFIVYLFSYSFLSLFICLFVCLFVCLFIYLFIYLFNIIIYQIAEVLTGKSRAFLFGVVSGMMIVPFVEVFGRDFFCGCPSCLFAVVGHPVVFLS